MEKEDAIKLAESGWWKDLPADVIVAFQLYERRLCMDFGDFHKAVEESLGRPVWTHEFADVEGLRAEFEGKRPPEVNPIASAERIFRKLGREDLIDKMIVVETDRYTEGQ